MESVSLVFLVCGFLLHRNLPCRFLLQEVSCRFLLQKVSCRFLLQKRGVCVSRVSVRRMSMSSFILLGGLQVGGAPLGITLRKGLGLVRAAVSMVS
ncbi:MAG: hypothetical protein NZ941_08670 [Candidatus Caldarchaeum sp.]|nr:hypothetical protein [Candidatus Caldarchaeum sp.]